MPKVTSEDAARGCAFVTRLLGGNPAGTAALMTSWLLIEQPGPWPADALENVLGKAFPDGRFPGARLEQLRARGLRPLLIRAPGRHQRDQRATRTVFVASGVPGARWLERLVINDLAELAAIDLDAVVDGRPGHGEPVSTPLFLACTHGAKDMCCAVLGRPVAAALAENHPGLSWEVSHVGGDRWAGNLLVVPDGFLHGQLTPAEAVLVAKDALKGQVQLEQLRGRTASPTQWTQYAEIAVRRHAGLRGLDDAVATGERLNSDDTRTVTVRCPFGVYEVTVGKEAADGAGTSRCAGRVAPTGFHADTPRLLATV